MARRRKEAEPLATIWRVPDPMWDRVGAVLDEPDPPAKTGRPRIDRRKALDGLLYQGRSGCQWNQLPRELGDDASVHRTFQRWVAKGVLERVWAVLAEACEEVGGVEWQWQSADGCTGKARSGATRWARTPPTAANAA